MSDLLSDLNDAQRRAVTHGEGPILVVAGPGSGKTRVVSRRVAWLLREGVRADEVLAVTFTNKAAAELRERVDRLVPAAGLWVATFHSACARILRDHHDALGFPRAFSIYDEEDRRRLAGRVLRELNVPPETARAGAAVRKISEWKNRGIGPAEAEGASWRPDDRTLARAYALYERLLHEQGAMDFDDLLLKAHRLLEGHPEVLDEYRRRLRFVLVDEYQDTNRVQFLLARALASGTRNLCATGDPDQSIYGWRGADLRNILDFEEHYPDATVVRLEHNYRSTRSILDAAGHLIRRNRDRREKDLLSDSEAGAPVSVTVFDGTDEEGAAVVGTIRDLLDGGASPGEIAVFYRVNARSRAVEVALRRRAIPYQVVRGVEFFQRAEVKDLVAWLRILANPRDGEALARVLGAPRRGAGQGSLEKLLARASARGIPARDVLLEGPEAAGVRGRAAKALEATAEDVRRLLERPLDGVRDLLGSVVSVTGYRRWLESHWPEDHQERWENVEELLSAAAAHDRSAETGGGLRGFLEEVALVSDQDRFDSRAPRVTLMTLHTSKGLEFPHVFLVGVEEGLLPHARSTRTPAAVEEERRLLFVGMTRARRTLHLSACRRSGVWTDGVPPGPSRFLDEIGPGVRVRDLSSGAFHDASPPARFGARRAGPSSFEGVDAPFVDPVDGSVDAAPGETIARVLGAGEGGPGREVRVGQRVRHARFGAGRVRRLEPWGRTVRAVVEFRTGVKTLDLSVARLDPVGDGE